MECNISCKYMGISVDSIVEAHLKLQTYREQMIYIHNSDRSTWWIAYLSQLHLKISQSSNLPFVDRMTDVSNRYDTITMATCAKKTSVYAPMQWWTRRGQRRVSEGESAGYEVRGKISCPRRIFFYRLFGRDTANLVTYASYTMVSKTLYTTESSNDRIFCWTRDPFYCKVSVPLTNSRIFVECGLTNHSKLLAFRTWTFLDADQVQRWRRPAILMLERSCHQCLVQW